MGTTNLQQRLNDLFGYIRQGKIIEAMAEFYDKDAAMQENANPPTVGQAANIEREKQFMSGVKEWKGFNVTASAVGDNVTFYECSLDFIATSGQAVHMEQVVVSKWRDGKIVHERFYYDAGKKP
ncbi:MAG: nuclear transport factor 2 family protein [Nitrospira sp.]|nr:nuclear transport factor 2 family protein [Nitrospira sp.]